MRILIIDDDDQFRTMLRFMLEEEGYEVAEAPNGNKAIKMQRDIPADLVISDILMPEKEGLETIAEIHREFPATQIIAVSGCSSEALEIYLQSARAFGATKTLTKPFRRTELLAAIRTMTAKASVG